MAFNPQAYSQARPDLAVNWQRLHDPQWLAANPGAYNPIVVEYINAYPSLEAYLEADWQGNADARNNPAFNTVAPPATGFNPQLYGQLRPDLAVNWQRMQSGQTQGYAPEVVASIRNFPSFEAYLQNDYNNDPQGNDTRMAALAPAAPVTAAPANPYITAITPTTTPPPAAVTRPAPPAPAAGTSTPATVAQLNAARSSYGGDITDDNFAQWWAANGNAIDINQHPADKAFLQALAANGNAVAAAALPVIGATPSAPVVSAPTTTPQPTTPPPTPPPSVAGPAAPIRPDLQANWNLAQAAPWGQPVYGDVNLSNYIKSFATIADYVAADTAGNQDYGTRSQATAVIPVSGAAPATPVTPPAGAPAGVPSTSVRPDLQANWNAATAAPWGQSALTNYIKSFPNLAAYVADDAAGNKDYAQRSQATAVMLTVPRVVAPPPAAPPPGGGNPSASTVAALNAARADYRATTNGVPDYTDAKFIQWWAENANSVDISQYPKDFALLTALADNGSPQAFQILDVAGYENPASNEMLPIEQGLLQTAQPALLADAAADAGRRTLVDTLSGQATADYNAASQALSPEENARRLADEQATAETTAQTISASAGTAATEQLTALQASITAMKESLTGELAAKATALEQQVAAFTANLNTFDETQKAALAEQIAANQRDLEASIGAQRTALTQELTTLRGGVDTQSSAKRAALQQELAALRGVNTAEAAARRAALENEVASLTGIAGTKATAQQTALEQELASLRNVNTAEAAARRAALQQEIASLGAAATTQAGAQQTALEQELASLRNVNTTEANARKAALQQEIAGLRSASATEGTSRRTALEAEIAGLTKAQAPMAQARLDSANALSTAINLGLQSTTDALTAARAKQGYIGSSTFDANALGRATITAAQQAAQAMGGARELNAGDLRTIGARAATEGRSLEDILAGNERAIAGQEATGARALADLYATNESTVGTRGATGTRTIADQLAATKSNIAGQEAAGSRALTDLYAGNESAIGARGATGTRTIADLLANERAGIAGQGAVGERAIADTLATNESAVGARGALGESAIATDSANANLDITSRGATGARTLADILAEGQRAIGDTGAAATAAIKSNTGTGLMNVGNAGAAQSYQDKVVGSTQLRSLLDSLAQGSGNIANTRITAQQAARDLGTTAKQGYYDNAYTRGLAGTLAQPGLATGLTGTLTALGNYGNSGLNRTQNSLNWWASNPTVAPTPGSVPATVSTAGNDIAGLGAGLLGSAFNVANGKNIWGAPTQTDEQIRAEYFKRFPGSTAGFNT